MSLQEVADLIRAVLGTDALPIGPQTRLEADLQLESIDLLALDELLRVRHGDGVALGAYVAGLDFEAILGLTVGDVAAYVDRVRR